MPGQSSANGHPAVIAEPNIEPDESGERGKYDVGAGHTHCSDEGEGGGDEVVRIDTCGGDSSGESGELTPPADGGPTSDRRTAGQLPRLYIVLIAAMMCIGKAGDMLVR